MSEEDRQVHPQEPAEGAEENVQAPGAEKPGDREPDRGPTDEEGSAAHPQEPAEGSEEEVEAPGVEKARDDLGEKPGEPDDEGSGAA